MILQSGHPFYNITVDKKGQRNLYPEELSLINEWSEEAKKLFAEAEKLMNFISGNGRLITLAEKIFINPGSGINVATYLNDRCIFLYLIKHFSCNDLTAIIKENSGTKIFKDPYGRQTFNHWIEYLDTVKYINKHIDFLHDCRTNIQQYIRNNQGLTESDTLKLQDIQNIINTKINLLKNIQKQYEDKIKQAKHYHQTLSEKQALTSMYLQKITKASPVTFLKNRPPEGRVTRSGKSLPNSRKNKRKMQENKKSGRGDK